jgi:hypothetical protein
MKKWIILGILVLLFLFIIFGPLSFIGNGLIGNLYLNIFKKDGLFISNLITNGYPARVLASKNTPYLLIGAGLQSGGYPLELINTTSGEKINIDNDVGKMSGYPFSSNGDKFIYPVLRKDMVFVSNTNDKFYYYYDLYVYDISSKTKKLITAKADSHLLNTYDKSVYGWVDDTHIAYVCDSRRIYSPTKGCIYDIKSEKTTETSVPLSLIDPKVNEPNIPTSQDYMGCFNNFDGSMCAYVRLRFHVGDGMLFQEIWVKNKEKSEVVYRDVPRVSSLYWTADNHLYGAFTDKLLKLY